MSRPSAQFEFRPEEPQAVLEHMHRLRCEHRGWLNLQPGFEESDAPAVGSGIGRLFTGSVHEVPVCTWVAGARGRHGLEPDSLGVEHAAGARVVAELSRRGVQADEGWRLLQDHPRRGLVVLTPPDADQARQLAWLVRVGDELSTVPLTGDWLASVYEGNTRRR